MRPMGILANLIWVVVVIVHSLILIIVWHRIGDLSSIISGHSYAISSCRMLMEWGWRSFLRE